jgi:hypothetical protein
VACLGIYLNILIFHFYNLGQVSGALCAYRRITTSDDVFAHILQAMSASSECGLSRHGSGCMPEPGSQHHQQASQLQTAPSTSTQAASVDGEHSLVLISNMS